ncbi:type II toxin-antitoxin system prevent-host-death family antitoxin [Patescibacteria group bacterium AH-259-L05]|nr:type II toxin-antitoxin system prevent-host-death family antitoxin [Patescibacteria group bacterium AH-259-L05]
MVIIIGLKELRQRMSECAHKVKQGHSFVVVKRSRPLFKIVPLTQEEEWEEIIDFTKIKKGGVDIEKIEERL